MSLYNNVEKLILQKTGSGGRKSSPNNLVDNAVGGLGMGAFGTAAAGIAGNMAKNAGVSAAERLANKYIPAEVQKGLSIAGGMVSDYMQDGEDGGIGGVGLGLLDSGMFNNLLPGMSSVASQAKYWKRKIPLWGGITPTRAAEIYDQMMSQKLAKKNLFLVEVSSNLPVEMGGGSGISEIFNLFVTEIDYAPYTITGEKRRVGAANFDSVQSAEPVEMRITTMDDQYGSIKKWYAKHHGKVAAEDGTVGVPASYAIHFRIIHSFIEKNQAQTYEVWNETGKGVFTKSNETMSNHYEDIGLYRPANLEVNLSRREDGLQEIQMTFSQLDTFMKP